MLRSFDVYEISFLRSDREETLWEGWGTSNCPLGWGDGNLSVTSTTYGPVNVINCQRDVKRPHLGVLLSLSGRRCCWRFQERGRRRFDPSPVFRTRVGSRHYRSDPHGSVVDVAREFSLSSSMKVSSLSLVPTLVLLYVSPAHGLVLGWLTSKVNL